MLLLVSFPLTFHNLGTRDLWSSHEARAAQNAVHVRETGDFGPARLFDGRVEMQKPPLFYWMVAGIAYLGDRPVDAWAVRLPAALAGVVGMVGVYVLAWRRGRPAAGLLAALMLGTMLHYTWLGRVGRIDMPLAAAVGAALGCFYLGYRSLREGQPWAARGWLFLSYLAVAIAVLLKGPVGLALTALVAVVYLGVQKEPIWPWKGRGWVRLLHDLGVWWGVPLVLALTVPWFLYANQRTDGEFVRVFFVYHNFARGFGGAEELETHPWWFYGVRLVIDLFPWSVLLPVIGWLICRKGYWRLDPEARFGVVWFGVMVLFLSCMRFKRADYLVPAYPGAALVLGCVIDRWIHGASDRLRIVSRTAFAGAVIVSVAVWLVYVARLLPRWEPAREHRSLAAEARRLVAPPGPVILFRTEAHVLVYHLGRPVERIMEWENLDIWACQPYPVYVVMPPEWVAELPRRLEAGRLYPVTSNTALAGTAHEQPLVLLCSRPASP